MTFAPFPPSEFDSIHWAFSPPHAPAQGYYLLMSPLQKPILPQSSQRKHERKTQKTLWSYYPVGCGKATFLQWSHWCYAVFQSRRDGRIVENFARKTKSRRDDMILPRKHDTPSELFLRNVCYLQNTILITQAHTARPLNYLSLAAINVPDATLLTKITLLWRMTQWVGVSFLKTPKTFAANFANLRGFFLDQFVKNPRHTALAHGASVRGKKRDSQNSDAHPS